MPKLRRRSSEEKMRTAKRVKKFRKNSRVRIAEQLLDKAAKLDRRMDSNYRMNEQKRDTFAHKHRRDNTQHRAFEQVRNTVEHHERRRSVKRRAAEQSRNTCEHQARRKDTNRREMEQLRNTLEHQDRRQNSEYCAVEQNRNTIQHQACNANIRSTWMLLERKYRAEIQECADNICSSCGGLFYKKSGQLAEDNLMISVCALIPSLSSTMQSDQFWFCSTCLKSLMNNKVPTLCLQNGFKFPNVPEILRILTPLEEMLVALRLPFMQIRSLGSDRQSGLFGNVVNVPNDLDMCTSVIPRNFDETQTVQVMLMRQMKGKNPVRHETVRPHVVHEAAKYLMNTELYQAEGIVLSEHWSKSSENDIENFVPNLQEQNREVQQDNDSSSDEEEPEPINPGTQETLLLPPDDFADMIIKIAPGEGKIPLSIIRDVNAEVLSFPTIYGGMKRKFKEGLKVTYTDIAKSEIRNADRRACKPTKLLYSYKLMLLSRVAEAIQVCLRKKKKLDGTPVTAGQLRNFEYVSNLIQHDDGFRMLKTIRSSPAYWEAQQKKVMAMIRQFGIPTFFVTVTAAETKWPDLLRHLYKTKHKKDVSSEDLLNLTWADRAELIRDDPVICSQHYNHRFRSFLNNLVKPIGGVFSPLSVTDWYCRYEFQLRGSLHTHMLFWIPEAPKFKGDETNFNKLINYIDSYVTCQRVDDGEFGDLVQYQIHKHSHTCRKKIHGTSACRFNFPKPPMPETVILAPLAKDFNGLKKAKTDYLHLQEILVEMGRKFKDDIPFPSFLEQIGWAKERYFTAIQSSLKNSAIFLKRRTCDIYVNNYNNKMLANWAANMDIQLILDGYACAKYVVSYINKSSGGVAKLLRKTNEEIRLGNTNLRDRLRKFGNIFNNFTQISQQEAAVGLLGIPLVNCSRSDIYINTSLPHERTFLVKSQKELEELPENSEDIAASSMIEKYVDRPDELESISLAEFGAYYEYRKTSPLKSAIRLKSLPGYVYRRRDAKIIRFRNYGEHLDPRNYYREQLMLYVPWRNEETLLLKNMEELYNTNQIAIEQEKAKYVSGFSADEFIQNAKDELNKITEDNDTEIDPDIEFLYEEGTQTDFLKEIGVDKSSSKIEHLLSPKLIDNEKYNTMLRSLNEKQRKLLLHVVHLIKTNNLPFYHFISGGAGVGKTHIILATVQVLLRYFFKLPGQNLDSTFVLVCAPTGKAAFNVFGMTLHHCWRLPPNQYAGNMAELDESNCNTLRTKLRQLKLIIIDEVSMMSVQQLFQLNSRLKQIFNTERDFGGKSILVVGHLRQLPPVGGSLVFTVPRMYANMTSLPQVHGNYLWSRFSLYELVEIMRQKDDAKFCVALNNMSEGVMTPDDIKLLKSREISEYNKPPDNAIRLFRFNQDCSEYNEKVHASLPGETVISTAHDRIQGHGTDAQKQALLENAKRWTTGCADGLPLQVSLKEGALYFVSTNVDVSDGLFNGSTGQLKKIIFGITNSGERIPLRVFLSFDNPIVGATLRSSMQKYQQLNKINLIWTSIERFTRVLQKSGKNSKLQVVRTQIPLIASNGTTIHKAQGSSLKLVVLSLLRKLTRALIYVGCSRATSSNGLFLDGTFEAPTPPPLDDPVSLEIARLRSSPIKLSLTFLTDLDETVTKLMFHNVQSLHKHSLDVLSDHSFMAADILAFIEPWSLPEDKFTFPGFKIVQRADCASTRNSFGSMIFAKDTTSITAMKFTALSANPGHITTTHWITDNFVILVIYKSPKSKNVTLLQHVETLLKKLGNKKVMVLGDMNINLHESNSRCLQEIFKKFGLTSKLPDFCPTTDQGSQLDWCFSNKDDIKAWTYESTFSYHKPLCVTWPKTSNYGQKIKPTTVHTIQDDDMEVDDETTSLEPSTISQEKLNRPCETEADELLEKSNVILLQLWKRFGSRNLLHDDVEQIQIHLSQQRNLMDKCSALLASQALASYSNQEIDQRSTRLLPKPFLKYYTAVQTAADGNCFYNAMSLNLFGTEKYSRLIKLTILSDISKNELGYTYFVESHASTYEKMVQTALRDEAYANEYVAYAASKVLQRPIHSYDMDFGVCGTKSEKYFQRAMANPRYVPHRYLLFDTSYAKKRPVCLYHRNMHDGGVKNHFVALLQKNDKVPVFAANQDYYILFRQFGGKIPIH